MIAALEQVRAAEDELARVRDALRRAQAQVEVERRAKEAAEESARRAWRVALGTQ